MSSKKEQGKEYNIIPLEPIIVKTTKKNRHHWNKGTLLIVLGKRDCDGETIYFTHILEQKKTTVQKHYQLKLIKELKVGNYGIFDDEFEKVTKEEEEKGFKLWKQLKGEVLLEEI